MGKGLKAAYQEDIVVALKQKGIPVCLFKENRISFDRLALPCEGISPHAGNFASDVRAVLDGPAFASGGKLHGFFRIENAMIVVKAVGDDRWAHVWLNARRDDVLSVIDSLPDSKVVKRRFSVIT